jgi:hypothetical protein
MGLIQGIIGLSVAIVVFTSVFMTTVKGTNTSTWSASEVALWGTLSTVAIVGIVYGTANLFGIA